VLRRAAITCLLTVACADERAAMQRDSTRAGERGVAAGVAAAPSSAPPALLPAASAVEPAPSAVEPAAPPRSRQERALAELAGVAPARWGERLPGIMARLPQASGELALTFDACDATGVDAELIALLRKESIAATLFVSGAFASSHPDVVKELAADPLFEIENHGRHHRPCSVTGRGAFRLRGTRSVAEAALEIEEGAALIEGLTGRRPRFYRSGTAHYDDVCVALAQRLGYRVAGYTVAGDLGGGRSRAAIKKAVEGASDGAIVLMHMHRPGGNTAEGLADAVAALRARGVRFVRLSQVLP
jgi:peptidoglycan/xylan/chitin deacetylase (PgdA/CDA1 family)